MGFETEEDLRSTATPVLREELGTANTKVVPEFSYSAGRTDIVFTSVSDKYLKRRTEELGIEIPITNKSYLKTFLQLHNRGEITKEYFFKIGATDESVKRNALEWLIERNFVNETEDGKIRTAPYLRKHITQSFAVELKLTKWRQALKQAVRGRSFAEFRYVVLDADHVDAAIQNKPVFRDRGVGLASIDTSGNFVEHVSPQQERPFSSYQTWILNEKTLSKESRSLEA
jgi:hypothetical protein